jgi:hypothetical protein
MRKLFTFLIALVTIAFGAYAAQAQMCCTGVWSTKVTAVATNHLAFDAATTVGSTGGTSTSVTLTTTQTNDLVVVCIQANSGVITSVSDTASLIWTQIGVRTGTTAVYYAKAPSILSSDVITVNYNSTVGFDAVQAAAFSGSNTSTPLDSNGALPGTTTTSGTPLTLTTSNAKDLLFACYALNGGETAGAGWTLVPNSGSTGFDAFEYQIVNSTQSATPANLSSNTQIKAGIGSAVVSR